MRRATEAHDRLKTPVSRPNASHPRNIEAHALGTEQLFKRMKGHRRKVASRAGKSGMWSGNTDSQSGQTASHYGITEGNSGAMQADCGKTEGDEGRMEAQPENIE